MQKVGGGGGGVFIELVLLLKGSGRDSEDGKDGFCIPRGGGGREVWDGPFLFLRDVTIDKNGIFTGRVFLYHELFDNNRLFGLPSKKITCTLHLFSVLEL